MSSLSRARIVVVGAGVMGLSAAHALERRGATVTVMDAEGGATSASAVAAGMIAPGVESALEDAGAETAPLYGGAASMWPAFSARHGLTLTRDGADWIGPREELAGRLATLGFAFGRTAEGLHLPGEARVDARAALRRLADTLARPILLRRALGVVSNGGVVTLATDLGDIEADAVVLAAGWSAKAIKAPGLESILNVVAPVKGQLIVLEGEATQGVRRTTRSPCGYLVPSSAGLIAGATMEAGISDRDVTPSAVETLRGTAARIIPALEQAKVAQAWAGVRGATPDGLPIVGPTKLDGVFAALAPRRNGWLLAPLAAEIVAAAVAGEPEPRWAGSFRPDRFDPA
jgi:glycine oxidase